jgi:hypothetical protein
MTVADCILVWRVASACPDQRTHCRRARGNHPCEDRAVMTDGVWHSPRPALPAGLGSLIGDFPHKASRRILFRYCQAMHSRLRSLPTGEIRAATGCSSRPCQSPPGSGQRSGQRDAW